MSYNILVIEDNLEMAENITCILELAKYNVTHAPDGKAGVDLVQKIKPDLILCDVMMPVLDGYGVVHILNSDPETAAIPFIFLTAKADKSDFRTGMNLGADDYITKPFDGVDLLKVVEMRLKKSEALKASAGKASGDFTNAFDNSGAQKQPGILAANRPTRGFRKKDLIFMEGQSANDLYFIEKGKVKTYKLNYDGKELVTGLHHAGDFLGYAAVLEDKPYNKNAEALEEAQIAIIPKPEFLEFVYSNRDIARKFIQMLSGDLDEMENRLLNVAYQSVRQRVARALLKITESLSDKQSPVITVTRKDLAGIVGTATESLNRTLADFRDEALISISDEGLQLINRGKLEKLSR